jgi:hypothetical protein
LWLSLFGNLQVTINHFPSCMLLCLNGFEIAALTDSGFVLRGSVLGICLTIKCGRLRGKTANPNLHAVGSFAVRRCPRFDGCHARFFSWRNSTKHGSKL